MKTKASSVDVVGEPELGDSYRGDVLNECVRKKGMTVSKGGSHSTINKMTARTHSTYVEQGAGYITAVFERKEKGKKRTSEGRKCANYYFETPVNHDVSPKPKIMKEKAANNERKCV